MKFQIGIISTKELVQQLGNKQQKAGYAKKGSIGNNSMDAILSKLARYCNYEKLDGGKYNITEIFETPKPPNLIKMQSGLYQYIAPLILIKLLREHDENSKVSFPILTWARQIEMVNHNYMPIKYNQRIAGEYLDIDYPTVCEFFEKVDDTIRYYMESSLNYLDKSDVLKWYKVPMLKKRVVSRVNDQEGDITLMCEYEDVKATDEEVDYVLRCSEEIRLKLNIATNAECYYGKKSSQYKEELQKVLKQRDILYMYDSYEVFYTSKARCDNLLNRFDGNDNEAQLVAGFNKAFIEHIVDNAEKRHIKSFADKIVKEYRLDQGYITNISTLSELTIDKKSDDIRKELITDSNKGKMRKDFNVTRVSKEGYL